MKMSTKATTHNNHPVISNFMRLLGFKKKTQNFIRNLGFISKSKREHFFNNKNVILNQ